MLAWDELENRKGAKDRNGTLASYTSLFLAPFSLPKAWISTISFGASAESTSGFSAPMHTQSSIWIPSPRKAGGKRESGSRGTWTPLIVVGLDIVDFVQARGESERRMRKQTREET